MLSFYNFKWLYFCYCLIHLLHIPSQMDRFIPVPFWCDTCCFRFVGVDAFYFISPITIFYFVQIIILFFAEFVHNKILCLAALPDLQLGKCLYIHEVLSDCRQHAVYAAKCFHTLQPV